MEASHNRRPFATLMKWMSSLLIVGGVAYLHLTRQQDAIDPSPAPLTGVIRMGAQPAARAAGPESTPPAFDAALFSHRIQEAEQRAHRRVSEAERVFQNRLRELERHRGYLHWLEETASRSGRKMNHDRELLNVIRYAALDRLQNTARVDDWVRGQLQEEIDPWLQAFTRELHTASAELDRALTASREALAYDLAAAAHETHAPMAVLNPEDLRQQLLRMSIGGIAFRGGLLVAFVPVEIHGIVTAPLLRRIPPMVSRLAGRIFSKQIGIASAAGASALIDGPLPFGDMVGAVIAVGGTVYTVVEWNNLKQNFEENVVATVRSELLSVRSQGLREIRQHGSRQIAQSRQIQQGLLAQAQSGDAALAARR